MTKKEIKHIRHSLGITQSQFAERVGVSLYAVRSWEQGKRSPSTTAKKVINFLKKT